MRNHFSFSLYPNFHFSDIIAYVEELNFSGSKKDKLPDESLFRSQGIFIFTSLSSFSEAIKNEIGITLDLMPVVELNTDFINASDQYLLLNLKEYGTEEPNLLFMAEDRVYAFSNRHPLGQISKVFGDVLPRPFGKSTIVCFIFLSKVLNSHKQSLDDFIIKLRKLEDVFDYSEYRSLALEMERFSDRLEEFHDLLLRLQERSYKQVETQYISFDYRILIAESLSLQGRCRRRLGTLKELRQENEMKATEELNERIVRLNDIVKKLTALTVILMLPTLIASHFGMNFAYMPELRIGWAYPAVIAFQIIFMGIGFAIFKKIGWL